MGKAKVSAAFAALGVSAALLVTGSEAAIAQSTAGDCKPYHLAVPGTDKYTVDVCLSLVQIPRTRFFEFSWRDIDTTKGSAYLAARIAGEIYTLKESGTFREPVRDVWVAGCVAGDSCTRPQQITPTG
ncbi:hypothetical protein SAMN05421507_1445 [Lentzea jiangxiensis]|uniref:Uncharacterized protein n=1 Tax=Lentzea jiangxiensis TaxID=641025 RepID=A0A1H0X7A0_9PSEU|nr:hypothetical protein SAMN05421507_1445 [Lentzea jiangxiensis]